MSFASIREFHEAGAALCGNETIGWKVDKEKLIVPSARRLRLDMDIAVDANQGRMGVGFVLRDEHGALKATAMHTLTWLGLVLAAGLSAIHNALQFCVEGEYKEIMVYSDFLLSVQAITSHQEHLSIVGVIVDKIQRLWRTGHFLPLLHMRRSANALADRLSHFSFTAPQPSIWVEIDFPIWVEELAIVDVRS